MVSSSLDSRQISGNRFGCSNVTLVKRTIWSVCWLALSFTAFAAESENVLQVFADTLRRNTSQEPSPIALTATYVSRDGEPFLAFRLTNISQKPLSVSPSFLPWGSPASLIFAGIASDGTRVRNSYPIADPKPEDKVTIAPGEFREGMYPLSWGLSKEVAKPRKDIVLMWAYRYRIDLDRPVPIHNGVVVIPQRQ